MKNLSFPFSTHFRSIALSVVLSSTLFVGCESLYNEEPAPANEPLIEQIEGQWQITSLRINNLELLINGQKMTLDFNKLSVSEGEIDLTLDAGAVGSCSNSCDFVATNDRLLIGTFRQAGCGDALSEGDFELISISSTSFKFQAESTSTGQPNSIVILEGIRKR